MTIRISFDLDGVLVDFAPTFSRLLSKLHPEVYVLRHDECKEFYVERCFGLSRKAGRAAFATMTPAHWTGMAALPSPYNMQRLGGLQFNPEVELFACTARHGDIRDITQNWLIRHGLENVTLLMDEGNDKGPQLADLGIDFHIDDSVKHAKNVRDHGVASFILDYPYNQDAGEGIVRVDTIGDYLDIVLLD